MTPEQELFAGLQALSESAFPKQCRVCERVYRSPDDFFAHSRPLGDRHSGLKSSFDDDDRPIVELFRNCDCGSTLMDFFEDRRDTSARGLKRREVFGKMLALLENRGLPPEQSRPELKGLMNGRPSSLLEAMGVRLRHARAGRHRS